jgi:hypothetical protein
MVELIVGLIALLSAMGAALVAKAKQADRAEQKLKAEKDVRNETIEIHNAIRERSADTDERDRVRDKYTRPRE